MNPRTDDVDEEIPDRPTKPPTDGSFRYIMAAFQYSPPDSRQREIDTWYPQEEKVRCH
jgi:hypothetical protein